MRKTVQGAGFILVLMGVSGTIDHLAYQPIMGPFLNAFNRFLLPQLDFLTGYEVVANLSVSVIGVIVILAGNRFKAA